MILDSTVIIDLLRNRKEVVALIGALERRGEIFKTTSINEFEVWRGVAPVHTTKKEKVERFLKQLEHIYHIDSDTARRAGVIAQFLDREGFPVEPSDILVAGVALQQGEAVLTRNTKHFSRVPNLLVETY